jgi:GNAT superfamily N-acetyltransferase
MSDSLHCRAVTTASDRRQFVRIQREIYAGDPNWVPPIWRVQDELVGFRPHPFYHENRCQAFVVTRNGKTVGRVLAIINHGHNQRYKEKTGFFGFFECHDDIEAARVLFHTAEQWLLDQGMTHARGPVNPSLNYDGGLLVEGFDTPPTFLIPYNRDYYESLLLRCGYAKVQDLFSYEAGIEMLDHLDPKLKFVIDEATRRFKVTCRPIDPKNFNADVRTFLHIYNESLQGTWGYVPFSPAEIDHQAEGLKYLIVPGMTSIAEIDGRAVGAGFGLLDYNPLIKKMGGRLFPFGWLRLLFQKKRLTRLRMISSNVLPEYQKWGLGLVTLARVLPDAIAWGIQVGEFSWVLESNSLSRNTIERAGGLKSKTHRIYEKSIQTP